MARPSSFINTQANWIGCRSVLRSDSAWVGDSSTPFRKDAETMPAKHPAVTCAGACNQLQLRPPLHSEARDSLGVHQSTSDLVGGASIWRNDACKCGRY